MPNAKDYKPSDHGIFAGIAGPPGTGKSYLIKTMAEVGKTVVALTDSAELDLYAGSDIEYEVFMNAKEDYPRLLKWIETQSTRKEVTCIGIDHCSGGTTSPGVSELAMQHVLRIHNTTNPLDLAHGQAYIGHANNMREFLQTLRLAAFRGKHVLAAVLVQLRESENNPKPGGGTEFEERLLPAVHGTIRQHIAASFSLWLHSYTQGAGKNVSYLATALPDRIRPAKARVNWKQGVDAQKLPNRFKTILEGIA